MPHDIDLSELGKVEEKKSSGTMYKKTEFINLPQGQTTVRFISPKFRKYYNHYVNNAYILCLEDECPICKNNFKLMLEFHDNFREVKGWNHRNERYAVNVLDRTLVKICPSCKAEIKKSSNMFPAICPKCSAVIANELEVQLNKVKLLSKGPTLKDQVVALNESILDDTGNPVSITAYDVVLNVKGTGKETVINLIPFPNKNDVVVVEDSKLFDLDNSAIKLTAEEMIEMQSGISLKDIFAARKVSNPDKELEGVQDSVSEELQKKINALMGE